MVDKDGRKVAPQGRPIQEGYRLIRTDQPVEDHNTRAYAKVFSITAPIRDALIYRLDKTSPAQWKTLTAILAKNSIKTRQWLKGPTPRDNYYSSQGIFEHLKSTYAGKIPANAVPGNIYADRDYHSMMKYLDETELELKIKTFSSDFDFTNPEGVDPRPDSVKGLVDGEARTPSGSNQIIRTTVTDAVTLETPHLELGVSRRSGAFYIKDKATGEVFGSGAERNALGRVTVGKKVVWLALLLLANEDTVQSGKVHHERQVCRIDELVLLGIFLHPIQ